MPDNSNCKLTPAPIIFLEVSVLIIPTLGPFHILHPRYNAVSVLELLKAARPKRIVLASYSPQDLQSGSWRDEAELALFHVLPWAGEAKVEIQALDLSANLKVESERFREALSLFPQGQQVLQGATALEQSLQTLLTTPKTAQDFFSQETLALLREYHRGYARLFGEGPATGFRQERMERVAESLRPKAAGQEPTLVLADLLDYAMLRELLPDTQSPAPTPSSEAERQRSVLDRAWRLEESDDWAALLEQLQEVEGPEAQYCAAQIYLAAGQPQAALELLESLVHSDFQFPEYLPGYTLSRYGQLADWLGQRDQALRAYQAVLALSWAPKEAKETALAGQRTPFKPEG